MFVTGLVRRAGRYSLPEERVMTVREAILAAGGILAGADLDLVQVLRREEGHDLVLRVGLDFALRDADTVVVRPREGSE